MRHSPTLLRAIGAVAALATTGVHLYMWFNGVRHEHVIGPLFLLNVAAGVTIAILLLAWRHWVPLFLLAGLGASTLTAFTISTTVGLFGVHDHWTGKLVWTAATSESVAILAGLAGLLAEGHLARARETRRVSRRTPSHA